MILRVGMFCPTDALAIDSVAQLAPENVILDVTSTMPEIKRRDFREH